MINLELATRTKRIEDLKNVAISKLIITLKAKKWFSEKAQMHCLADLWLPLHINIFVYSLAVYFSRNRNTLVFVIFQFVLSLKLFFVTHPRL